MKKTISCPDLVDTTLSVKCKNSIMKKTKSLHNLGTSCSALSPHEHYALLHTNMFQGKTCIQEYDATKSNTSQKERETELALCLSAPPELETQHNLKDTSHVMQKTMPQNAWWRRYMWYISKWWKYRLGRWQRI